MGKRGRPTNEPTEEVRAKVKELLQEGASQRVIAAAVEMSLPTLRKYFHSELFSGKKIKEAPKPEFKITGTMREDVELMAACNEPIDRIARAIGCSADQIGVLFSEELSAGAARYRLKTLKRLDRLADAGTIGAAKQLEALTAAPDSGEQAPQRGASYVGKKAAAKADADAAVAAGGKFAPRSAPRIAVDNTKK